MGTWQPLLMDVMRRRSHALIAYAGFFTGNTADAEDVVQEALIRTFSRGHRFENVTAAEAYVRRAIPSVFIDRGRSATSTWRALVHVANRGTAMPLSLPLATPTSIPLASSSPSSSPIPSPSLSPSPTADADSGLGVPAWVAPLPSGPPPGDIVDNATLRLVLDARGPRHPRPHPLCGLRAGLRRANTRHPSLSTAVGVLSLGQPWQQGVSS